MPETLTPEPSVFEAKIPPRRERGTPALLRSVLAFSGLLVLSFSPSLTGLLFPPGGWYAALAKPSWTPPGWLFGPVWTLLYFSMAVAAFLVWRRPASRARTRALVLFGVQLGLNALWTPLFFGAHLPGLALAEIVLLDVAVVATLFAFWRLRRAAGALLVPYLAWSLFATALNAAIFWLNLP
jgi:tryptophan-rich sensory protein